ncbi:protein CYSTEINE-RICH TRANSMEMBRANE MODULE 4-like [Rutidosis leptorrhynchoides]|uniref:protein CYSTEINE-RICH TRANSMEMBRANE MODULE 4-like n=1 Tax=Rutidosis leptorrhynchoides TaxID=125765 RepID=UPI003A98EACA
MSHIDQQNIHPAYPPTMEKQGPTLTKQGPTPLAPVGYPTTAVTENEVPTHTTSRGDDFWKGCCSALCCCCALDACF